MAPARPTKHIARGCATMLLGETCGEFGWKSYTVECVAVFQINFCIAFFLGLVFLRCFLKSCFGSEKGHCFEVILWIVVGQFGGKVSYSKWSDSRCFQMLHFFQCMEKRTGKLSGPGDRRLALDFGTQAYRSKQIFDIWTEVWSGQRSRLKYVISTQAVAWRQ